MPVAKRGAVVGCVLLLSTGGAANAESPTADRPTSATTARAASVTLITGDRVIVQGDQTTVDPAEGRENIQFLTRDVDGHRHVVPSDAMALVDNGALDVRLFDVTTLREFGYDDASTDELPLIVRQSGDRAAPSSATVTQSLPSIGGSGVLAPKDTISDFWKSVTNDDDAQALSNGVRHIWLDGKREALLDRSAAQIGAPQAWEQDVTGKGVTVAVLDTGVDQTHPDLADREVGQRNFSGSETPEDKFGHGTHVAGIVAGTGASSQGKYRGIAHGAEILDGKVLDDSGSGRESGIIAGLQWAADQKADIANLSLGSGDSPGIDPLEEAVNSLSEKTDTLFVVAAGNSGPSAETLGSPGSADAALTVGAVDREEVLAEFSSRGPRVGDGGIKPDITAPGVGIVSTLHSAGTIGEPIDGRYTALDGTSMAAPHVAGAAALVAQARPDLSGEQLKAVLTSSAKSHPNHTPFEQGSGRVDVHAALAQTVVSEQSSLSFGNQRWPHDDDQPVTKPLTYRNTSDAPVTLNLAVQGAGVPFTLDRQQVTVPPKGTARVSVTADTRLDVPDGIHSAIVTATGGDTTVRTPASVVKEVESYDLTIHNIGKNGRPGQATVTLLNLETGESKMIPGGTDTVRMPKGKYALNSVMTTGKLPKLIMHMMVRPGIDLTRNQTVTVDFREAKPLVINPPYAGSKPQSSIATSQYRLPAGSAGTSVVGTSFQGMTVGHSGPSEPALTTSIKTDGTSDAGKYQLAWFEPGRMPSGLQKDVDRGEMATVHHHLEAPTGQGQGYFGSTPTLGDATSGLSLLQPGPLPRKVTTHYNTVPGVQWRSSLQQFTQDREVALDLEAPPKRYEAGQQREAWYNIAPFGPGNPKTPLDWAARYRNDLFASLPLFTDGAGNGGIALAEGKTELHRDGELIDSETVPGQMNAQLPAEAGNYRLTTEAHRESGLSPHVSASWTFSSAETSQMEPLPLLAVRFQPELDNSNSAPAGQHQDVPVFVQGVDGTVVSPTELKVEVSYDQGKTWAVVPVTDGKVGLDYPEDATSVSLRASAGDNQGNTVEHTVISAYKLKN